MHCERFSFLFATIAWRDHFRRITLRFILSLFLRDIKLDSEQIIRDSYAELRYISASIFPAARLIIITLRAAVTLLWKATKPIRYEAA